MTHFNQIVADQTPVQDRGPGPQAEGIGRDRPPSTRRSVDGADLRAFGGKAWLLSLLHGSRNVTHVINLRGSFWPQNVTMKLFLRSEAGTLSSLLSGNERHLSAALVSIALMIFFFFLPLIMCGFTESL